MIVDTVPDKVVTDPGGGGDVVRHLHPHLLPLQHGHICVPVDGGLAAVIDPVHGTCLWCQFSQFHGFTQSIPECDTMFDWYTGPPVVTQLCPQ